VGPVPSRLLEALRSRGRYRDRTNSSRAALTSAGRSCWIQRPQPGSTMVWGEVGHKSLQVGGRLFATRKVVHDVPVADHVQRGWGDQRALPGGPTAPSCDRCSDTS